MSIRVEVIMTMQGLRVQTVNGNRVTWSAGPFSEDEANACLVGMRAFADPHHVTFPDAPLGPTGPH